MSEKDNDQPEWVEKLFSTQVILTAILILGIYWVFLVHSGVIEAPR